MKMLTHLTKPMHQIIPCTFRMFKNVHNTPTGRVLSSHIRLGHAYAIINAMNIKFKASVLVASGYRLAHRSHIAVE